MIMNYMSRMTGNEKKSGGPAPAELLATDGFVLLHRLCDDEFLASVRTVATRHAAEMRAALGDRHIGIGSAAGYREIVQRSPGRWDVPIEARQFGREDRDMPWWPLVASVLGGDAEHSFSGVVTSEPGSPAQQWHTDSPHEVPEHVAPHALNVLVALHDLPKAMGPTECARGSHVLTNHLGNPSLVIERLIYQHEGTTPESLVAGTRHAVPERCASPMAAGSCLVFDDRLLHRGLANGSDAERHVAYFSYRKSGYTTNTHFESPRSLFDSAD
jgi:hypothetical protein